MSTDDSTPSVQYLPITGFPHYRVGDDGSVWTTRRRKGGRPQDQGTVTAVWRRVQPSPHGDGGLYRAVNLTRVREDGTFERQVLKAIHALVLTAFRGPRPSGMETCHENGLPHDNRLSNLRWDTHHANIADRDRHGRTVKGSRVHSAKLREKDVVDIKQRLANGEHPRVIAARYRIDRTTVMAIRSNHTWKHVPSQTQASHELP